MTQATYTVTFDPGRWLTADERDAIKTRMAQAVRNVAQPVVLFGGPEAFEPKVLCAIDQCQETDPQP